MDLSEGGMFIPMPCPLPEGAKVVVEFFLESAGKTIQAEGNVVRSNEEGTDETSGMAIAFTNLGKEGRRLVELVVQRYSRHHPSQVVELPPGLLGKDGLSDGEAPALEIPKIGLRICLRRSDEDADVELSGHTLDRQEIFVLTESAVDVGTEVALKLSRGDGRPWKSAIGIVTARVYSPGTEDVPGGPGIVVEIRSPSLAVISILSGAVLCSTP